MIIVYTKPNCSACMMTKIAAKKLGIEVEERAFTEEDLLLFRGKGYTSAPVVIGKSGREWSGFRPDLLNLEGDSK